MNSSVYYLYSNFYQAKNTAHIESHLRRSNYTRLNALGNHLMRLLSLMTEKTSSLQILKKLKINSGTSYYFPDFRKVSF